MFRYIGSGHLGSLGSFGFLKFVTRRFRFVRGEKLTSSVYLQVVGTSNADSTPSLLLVSDEKSFLFNCGENTNRIFLQYEKLFSAKHIFLTGDTWDHVGGFGMMLSRTMSDFKKLANSRESAHQETLNIYMPSKLNIFKHLININKDHVIKSMMKPGMVVFEDVNLRLKVLNINTLNSSGTYASYIGEVKSLPGKFDGKKADSLQISRPNRTLLAEGKTITLKNGIVVKPQDIIGPERCGQIFVILDCPSLDIMEHLTKQEDLLNFQEKNHDKQTLIVHLTPHNVFTHPEYSKLMEMLGDSDHLLINKDVCSQEVILKQSFLTTQKLNQIHPKMFPLLHSSQMQNLAIQLPRNVTAASSLLRYNFRPLNKQGYDLCDVKANTDKWRYLGLNNNKRHDVPTSFSKNMKPEVIFLGTAGTTSTSPRNVTAILVRISYSKSILLDCGEGTLTQLKHHYGGAIDDIIRSIKCIFISHGHEDHIMGLTSLMLYRERLFNQFQDNEPVTVVGPDYLERFLDNLSMMTRKLNFRFEKFASVKAADDYDSTSSLTSLLGITMFRPVTVHHIKSTHGLVIGNKNPNWKIVYSADTRPCQRLISRGKDATLLIHEATFEDEDVDFAIARKHSTVSEAIRVGVEMNAQHTILTHIGNRYDAINLPTHRRSRISQAFDHMQVQLDNLSELVDISPTVNRLFGPKRETFERERRPTRTAGNKSYQRYN